MNQTTWIGVTPRLSVSQLNAKHIVNAINTAKSPMTTKQLCKLLNITDSQFQSAKPYFKGLLGYKSVALHWYASEHIEAAQKKYATEKELIRCAYSKVSNHKRRIKLEVKHG
jgi:hypothetical protein